MKYLLALCLSIILSLPSMAQSRIEVESTLILNNLDTVNSAAHIVVRAANGTLSKQNFEKNEDVGLEKPLPYFPNYEDYGAGYENGIYYMDDNRVYLGGLIKRINGQITNGDTICILPAGYQPLRRVLLNGFQNSQSIRINIESDGVVRVLSNNEAGNVDFISLDGMSFYRWLQIGDYIDGGYLFYVADPPADLDGDGVLDRGLLAATEDQGRVVWGCHGTATGVINAALGSGKTNTDLILAQCAEPNIAARLCDDLVLNGHDDWYLPSQDEAELMWQNLADSDGDGINAGPSDPNNIGDFLRNPYATSTEYNLDPTMLIQMVHMRTGSIQSGQKNLLSWVRAIRAF